MGLSASKESLSVDLLCGANGGVDIMKVVREISREPKTVKCGEDADYMAEKIIESEQYPYSDWRPYTAMKKAHNDIERYVDAAKDEVTKAAKEWVESVQCKGKSEKCLSGECRKDIKLRTGDASVEYSYSGTLLRRGNVICTATITGETQTVHCNCLEKAGKKG
jgi:hypothetical protein